MLLFHVQFLLWVLQQQQQLRCSNLYFLTIVWSICSYAAKDLWKKSGENILPWMIFKARSKQLKACDGLRLCTNETSRPVMVRLVYFNAVALETSINKSEGCNFWRREVCLIYSTWIVFQHFVYWLYISVFDDLWWICRDMRKFRLVPGLLPPETLVSLKCFNTALIRSWSFVEECFMFDDSTLVKASFRTRTSSLQSSMVVVEWCSGPFCCFRTSL